MLYSATLAASLVLVSTLVLRAQDPRIESARVQSEWPRGPGPAKPESGMEFSLEESEVPADDSFGVQQILKRQERPKYFRAYADLSGTVTDNVALTRLDPRHDTLLVATFGLEVQRPLTRSLAVAGLVRAAYFRYNRERALDFDSYDVGAALVCRPPPLPGAEFSARYNFQELRSDKADRTFFQNHTLTLAGQKVWPLGRAAAVYAGASVLWGWADPESAARRELTAYAGAHAQLSRSLGLELLYRHGWWRYRVGDRHDRNQTLSLALRWRVTDWAELYALGFSTWNHSNLAVFAYEASSLGGGLGCQVRF
jgi:hypothetical protein